MSSSSALPTASRSATSSAVSTPPVSSSVTSSAVSTAPSATSAPPTASAPPSSSSSVSASISQSISSSISASVSASNSASSASVSQSLSLSNSLSVSASQSASVSASLSLSSSVAASLSASASASSSSEQSTSFSTSFTTRFVTDSRGQSSASVSASSGTANNNNNTSSSTSPGTIAGAVVGGIVGLLALLALGWFLIRRKRRQSEVAFDEKTVRYRPLCRVDRVRADTQFDPANRYSRSDPLDLAAAPAEHFAGGAGGQIEPFPYAHPTSPQPNAATDEGYDPYQQAANRSSWHNHPTMAQMQMPDARNYQANGGWYGNDGYGVAAGMAGAGAAGVGAGAAAAAYGSRQQSERDYRSETASTQGGESNSQYGYGSSSQHPPMPPLTPAALAKQREAGGSRPGYQSHGSRASHGSGGYGGPSGAAGVLPSTSEHGQGSGHGGEPTSPGVDERRRSSAGLSDGRVYQHADMPGQDEQDAPVEIPPK